MQKTNKPKKKKSPKRWRVGLSIAQEIILLAATLLNSYFAPLPWRLILPLVVGFWTIWVKYRHDTTLRRAMLVESVFMALNVAANLLPLYWRLGAFFLLGVRSIFIRHLHRHADGKACLCDNPPAEKEQKNAKKVGKKAA